jgi:hypothetical protein
MLATGIEASIEVLELGVLVYRIPNPTNTTMEAATANQLYFGFAFSFSFSKLCSIASN